MENYLKSRSWEKKSVNIYHSKTPTEKISSVMKKFNSEKAIKQVHEPCLNVKKKNYSNELNIPREQIKTLNFNENLGADKKPFLNDKEIIGANSLLNNNTNYKDKKEHMNNIFQIGTLFEYNDDKNCNQSLYDVITNTPAKKKFNNFSNKKFNLRNHNLNSYPNKNPKRYYYKKAFNNKQKSYYYSNNNNYFYNKNDYYGYSSNKHNNFNSKGARENHQNQMLINYADENNCFRHHYFSYQNASKQIFDEKQIMDQNHSDILKTKELDEKFKNQLSKKIKQNISFYTMKKNNLKDNIEVEFVKTKRLYQGKNNNINNNDNSQRRKNKLKKPKENKFSQNSNNPDNLQNEINLDDSLLLQKMSKCIDDINDSNIIQDKKSNNNSKLNYTNNSIQSHQDNNINIENIVINNNFNISVDNSNNNVKEVMIHDCDNNELPKNKLSCRKIFYFDCDKNDKNFPDISKSNKTTLNSFSGPHQYKYTQDKDLIESELSFLKNIKLFIYLFIILAHDNTNKNSDKIDINIELTKSNSITPTTNNNIPMNINNYFNIILPNGSCENKNFSLEISISKDINKKKFKSKNFQKNESQ